MDSGKFQNLHVNMPYCTCIDQLCILGANSYDLNSSI